MRDRDVQELGAAARAAPSTGGWRAARQRFDALRRRLERRDVRRVAADLRTRLVARRRPAARSSSRAPAWRPTRAPASSPARLDALSPLAVLGRGYAVCWNEARTSIIRSAAHGHARATRVRVTLAEGELGCRVERHRAST